MNVPLRIDRLVTEQALADAWGLTQDQVRNTLRYAGAPHILLQRGKALYDGDVLYDWLMEHRQRRVTE